MGKLPKEYQTDAIGNLAASVIFANLRKKKKEMKYVFHYPKEELNRKPVVLLSDHASYNHGLNVPAGYPRTTPFVAVMGSVHEREPMLGVFCQHIGVIYKKMYVPDMPSSLKMLNATRQGCSLLLYPEGTASYCGLTHPISEELGGFLKLLNLDIVAVSTVGAHLSEPKYCQDRKAGPVELHYHHIFTPEQLKETSAEDVFEKVMEYMTYNDFKWNAEQKYKYIGKEPNAVGLDQPLYYCPCCGEDGHLYTDNDKLICGKCGNTIVVDETYAISPASEKDMLPYERIDQWYLDQRRILRKEIRENENFEMRFNIGLSKLNMFDRKSMFRNAGRGEMIINREGVTYKGTSDGEQVEYFLPIKGYYGAGNQMGRYLVLYYGKETLAFDFGEPKSTLITKACGAIEEIHALINPVWNRALERVFKYDEENL